MQCYEILQLKIIKLSSELLHSISSCPLHMRLYQLAAHSGSRSGVIHWEHYDRRLFMPSMFFLRDDLRACEVYGQDI